MAEKTLQERLREYGFDDGYQVRLYLEAADELDRLTAQLKEAHRALKRYGGHRGLCMSDFGTPADASCYCGFEAALAATEPKP